MFLSATALRCEYKSSAQSTLLINNLTMILIYYKTYNFIFEDIFIHVKFFLMIFLSIIKLHKFPKNKNSNTEI